MNKKHKNTVAKNAIYQQQRERKWYWEGECISRKNIIKQIGDLFYYQTLCLMK